MVQTRRIDLLVEQLEIELVIILGVKEKDLFTIETIQQLIQMDPNIFLAEQVGSVENVGNIFAQKRTQDVVYLALFLHPDGVCDESALLSVAFELGTDVPVQILVVGLEEFEFLADVVRDLFEVAGHHVLFPELQFQLVFLNLATLEEFMRVYGV